MNRVLSVLCAVSFLGMPVIVSAQGALTDTLGQIAGSANSGWPESCLSLKDPEKPKSVARFDADAEPALRAYLALAATGADPTPAYKRTWSDRWTLDGVVTDKLPNVRDPWAARVDRLEPIGIILGRGEVFGHGVWRAYAADGTWLGTYQAEMIRKTKGYAIGRIALWSPGQEGKGKPLTPYCAMPGDTEDYLKAKAEADAKKSARQAEKEARTKAANAGR